MKVIYILEGQNGKSNLIPFLSPTGFAGPDPKGMWIHAKKPLDGEAGECKTHGVQPLILILYPTSPAPWAISFPGMDFLGIHFSPLDIELPAGISFNCST